jgi:hypothetical protein
MSCFYGQTSIFYKGSLHKPPYIKSAKDVKDFLRLEQVSSLLDKPSTIYRPTH